MGNHGSSPGKDQLDPTEGIKGHAVFAIVPELNVCQIELDYLEFSMINTI